MALLAPDLLIVEPNHIQFGTGLISTTVQVANLHSEVPVPWEAAVDEDWVTLSAISGTTPGSFEVTYDPPRWPDGVYVATITVSSPVLPGQEALVLVEMVIEGGAGELCLPLIWRGT